MMSLLAIILVWLSIGCTASHGFNRDTMNAIVHQQSNGVAGAPARADTTEARPLPIPFRLALFFVHRDFPDNGVVHKPDWVSADKEAVLRGLAPLRQDGVVNDVFILEDPIINDHDERKIRQAAQRYGADAVLIVDGVAAIDRFNNGSAWLYATLIGAYLANGTESEALFLIDAGLWSVRSGVRHATQQAEGSSKQVGPAMSVEDRQVFAEAKRAALNDFSNKIVEQLRGLR